VPTEIANSPYLDLNSYRSTADPLTDGTPIALLTMNVALVLERARRGSRCATRSGRAQAGTSANALGRASVAG
jgi:hypothetical protein